MTIVDEGKIDEQAAAEHIHGICLKTGPPRRVGIEIEWLVRDARNPAIGVSAERITDAMSGFAAAPGLPTSSSPGVLPSGAPLTTEPGGQLELSSLPADSLADCVRATADDLAALRAAADAAGLELAGFGLDPLRPPRRVLELPRYAAMEAFFDRGGPWGRQMMCTTASIQVCLDAGDDSDWTQRLPAPVAAAARHRPGARRRVRELPAPGRAADRLAVVQAAGLVADGPRPHPAADARPGPARGVGPVRARRRAHVRPQRGVGRLVGAGRADAQGLGPRRRRRPDATALRGRPGVSPVHAVPAGPAARALRAADDRRAARRRLDRAAGGRQRAVRRRPGGRRRAGGRRAAVGGPRPAGEWPSGQPNGNPWPRAARLGPADPAIAEASRECFAAARSALDRMAVPAPITAAVDDFIEHYVGRNRCPADDLLEESP